MQKIMNLRDLVFLNDGRVELSTQELRELEGAYDIYTAGGANNSCIGQTNTLCANGSCSHSSNTTCENTHCGASSNTYCDGHVQP